MFLKTVPTTVLRNQCCLKTLVNAITLGYSVTKKLDAIFLCLPVSEPLGERRIALVELLVPKLRKYKKK